MEAGLEGSQCSRDPPAVCPVPTGPHTCTSFLGKGPRSFSGQLMGGMTQSLFCRRRPWPGSGKVSTSGCVSCGESGTARCWHLAEPSAHSALGRGAALYLLVVVTVVPPPAQGHPGRMLLACVVPGMDGEADLPLLELQRPGRRDDTVPAHLEACVIREVRGVPLLAAVHKTHWGQGERVGREVPVLPRWELPRAGQAPWDRQARGCRTA